MVVIVPKMFFNKSVSSMKMAILLTGFNNWGKSTHIYDLFGRKVFFKGSTT
jgi:GTP-binding protein EngB required for normal cell division